MPRNLEEIVCVQHSTSGQFQSLELSFAKDRGNNSLPSKAIG
jgi:hypothetical protein